MSNTQLTLAQYRAQHGGYCAVIPADLNISHVITKPIEISERMPPSPGWPDGSVVRHIGPETLEVITTADGYRVVRFRSPDAFRNLCKGANGLAWHDANSELRQQIARESQNRAGPI